MRLVKTLTDCITYFGAERPHVGRELSKFEEKNEVHCRKCMTFKERCEGELVVVIGAVVDKNDMMRRICR
jgi:16S rRNA C1402 (ribose-2'-O) methylase RsmI